MNTFEESNWKYELPFNNELYRDVKHFSFLHTSAERKILDAQINFYRHHFSFEQLLNAFKQCEEDNIAHFKEVVYKRRNDILYLPEFLELHYYNRIKTEFKNHADFLLEMLNIALNKPCRKNPVGELYSLILGSYLKPVKKKINRYAKRKVVDHVDLKILPKDYVLRTEEIISQLKLDHLAHGIFGEFSDNKIKIDKHTGYGNCEVKCGVFYPGNDDLFTITTGENTLKLEELRHDIYANIYPGRAHFYNTIVPKSDHNLDLGATWLLNGWDTFVAWHIKPSGYTRNSKTIYSKICTYLFKGNYKKALKDLYIYLLATFSADKAMRGIITITQYPGMLESFVLGGLATEFLIDYDFAGSPQDLLNRYKYINCGDFFALYKK